MPQHKDAHLPAQKKRWATRNNNKKLIKDNICVNYSTQLIVSN